MSEQIQTFYVVTQSTHAASLYVVTNSGGDYGQPVAVKIGIKGQSNAGVGNRLTGKMIGIGRHLLPFSMGEGGVDGVESIERLLVETGRGSWWWGGSSPVIALFMRQEDAKRCLEAPGLVPCDPRWIEETQQVLQAIGSNHPAFAVFRRPEIALISESDVSVFSST